MSDVPLIMYVYVYCIPYQSGYLYDILKIVKAVLNLISCGLQINNIHYTAHVEQILLIT